MLAIYKYHNYIYDTYLLDATIQFLSLINTVEEMDVDFTFDLIIDRNTKSEQTYLVSLSGSSITAEEDDYSLTTTTFQFPPDVSNITVPVTIHGDITPELTEIFEVRLHHRRGPTFQINQSRTLTVAIIDNDGGEVL